MKFYLFSLSVWRNCAKKTKKTKKKIYLNEINFKGFGIKIIYQVLTADGSKSKDIQALEAL